MVTYNNQNSLSECAVVKATHYENAYSVNMCTRNPKVLLVLPELLPSNQFHLLCCTRHQNYSHILHPNHSNHCPLQSVEGFLMSLQYLYFILSSN